MSRRCLANIAGAWEWYVLVIVGAGAITLTAYNAWYREYRLPSSQRRSCIFSDMAGGEIVGCRSWQTSGGDLFYAVAAAHMKYEPIEPVIAVEYTWSENEGGRLIVNDRLITYARPARLLANGPFGEWHELELTPSEEELVLNGVATVVWQDIVEKRLYRFEGEMAKRRHSDIKDGVKGTHTDDKVRVGHWVCRDTQDRIAYEGDYVDGRRHGTWTYYYASGSVRAVISYEDGWREGPWHYYDEAGALVDTITWHKGTPVERTLRTGALFGVEVNNRDGPCSFHSGR